MDIKESYENKSLVEHDESSNFQSSAPPSIQTQKKDVDISVSKNDTPTTRPCAVIAPGVQNKIHQQNDLWAEPNAFYKHHGLMKPGDSYPSRNISPRQTFQENMPRIMLPPRIEPLKPGLDSYPPGYMKQTTSKYCEVPYMMNTNMTDHRKDIYMIPDTPSPRAYSHYYSGYPPTPTRYDYQCSVSPGQCNKQTPTKPEELQQMYKDSYFRGSNIRFEAYPALKEKYPRYDYSNIPHPYATHPYSLSNNIKHHHPYVNIDTAHRFLDPKILELNKDYSKSGADVPYVYNPNYGPPPTRFPYPNRYNYPIENDSRNLVRLNTPYIQNRSIDYENRLREGQYSPAYQNIKGRLPQNYPLLKSVQRMSQVRHTKLVEPEYSAMKTFDRFHNTMYNPLANIPTQFSPNIISPNDSIESIEGAPNFLSSHDDSGYLSQCSTNSTEYQQHNSYGYHPGIYGSYSPSTKNVQYNNKNDKSKLAKDKSLNLRSYLENWDEGFEESPEVTAKSQTHNGGVAPTLPSETQLVVLDAINIPQEELAKYEHIQKVSKLPDNIRGFDNNELLKQFEKAIGSTESNSKDLRSSNVTAIDISKVNMPLKRPVSPNNRSSSPLDFEAKISQSVIHKEVKCNFEIRPCTPSQLNISVQPVRLNMTNKIENYENNLLKLNANLSSKKNLPNAVLTQPNHDKTPPTYVKECISKSPKVVENDNTLAENCGTVSNICFASLPRLDTEIELNIPEINQQYENQHFDSVITNSNNVCNKTESINNSNINSASKMSIESKISKQLLAVDNQNHISDYIIPEKHVTSKLSKFRINKNGSSGTKDILPLNPITNINERVDSVIINPCEKSPKIDISTVNLPENSDVVKDDNCEIKHFGNISINEAINLSLHSSELEEISFSDKKCGAENAMINNSKSHNIKLEETVCENLTADNVNENLLGNEKSTNNTSDNAITIHQKLCEDNLSENVDPKCSKPELNNASFENSPSLGLNLSLNLAYQNTSVGEVKIQNMNTVNKSDSSFDFQFKEDNVQKEKDEYSQYNNGHYSCIDTQTKAKKITTEKDQHLSKTINCSSEFNEDKESKNNITLIDKRICESYGDIIPQDKEINRKESESVKDDQNIADKNESIVTLANCEKNYSCQHFNENIHSKSSNIEGSATLSESSKNKLTEEIKSNIVNSETNKKPLIDTVNTENNEKNLNKIKERYEEIVSSQIKSPAEQYAREIDAKIEDDLKDFSNLTSDYRKNENDFSSSDSDSSSDSSSSSSDTDDSRSSSPYLHENISDKEVGRFDKISDEIVSAYAIVKNNSISDGIPPSINDSNIEKIDLPALLEVGENVDSRNESSNEISVSAGDKEAERFDKISDAMVSANVILKNNSNSESIPSSINDINVEKIDLPALLEFGETVDNRIESSNEISVSAGDKEAGRFDKISDEMVSANVILKNYSNSDGSSSSINDSSIEKIDLSALLEVGETVDNSNESRNEISVSAGDKEPGRFDKISDEMVSANVIVKNNSNSEAISSSLNDSNIEKIDFSALLEVGETVDNRNEISVSAGDKEAGRFDKISDEMVSANVIVKPNSNSESIPSSINDSNIEKKHLPSILEVAGNVDIRNESSNEVAVSAGDKEAGRFYEVSGEMVTANAIVNNNSNSDGIPSSINDSTCEKKDIPSQFKVRENVDSRNEFSYEMAVSAYSSTSKNNDNIYHNAADDNLEETSQPLKSVQIDTSLITEQDNTIKKELELKENNAHKIVDATLASENSYIEKSIGAQHDLIIRPESDNKKETPITMPEDTPPINEVNERSKDVKDDKSPNNNSNFFDEKEAFCEIKQRGIVAYSESSESEDDTECLTPNDSLKPEYEVNRQNSFQILKESFERNTILNANIETEQAKYFPSHFPMKSSIDTSINHNTGNEKGHNRARHLKRSKSMDSFLSDEFHLSKIKNKVTGSKSVIEGVSIFKKRILEKNLTSVELTPISSTNVDKEVNVYMEADSTQTDGDVVYKEELIYKEEHLDSPTDSKNCLENISESSNVSDYNISRETEISDSLDNLQLGQSSSMRDDEISSASTTQFLEANCDGTVQVLNYSLDEANDVWFDNVACVETVVSENVDDRDDDESISLEQFSNEYHEEYAKIQFYNDHNEIKAMESIFRTPGMEVSTQLVSELLDSFEEEVNSLGHDSFHNDSQNNTPKLRNADFKRDSDDSNDKEVCDSQGDDSMQYRVETILTKDGPPKTLITKAAQKYIPPLILNIKDYKVRIPMSPKRLERYRRLKEQKTKNKKHLPELKSKPVQTAISTENKKFNSTPKKSKPNFEDVLKTIDRTMKVSLLTQHKVRRKSIPKMIIKKNKNGSHYSTSVQKSNSTPDLSGNKWQPWVCLKKDDFIEKMVLKNKYRAIYCHRTHRYAILHPMVVSNVVKKSVEEYYRDKSNPSLKYTFKLDNTLNDSRKGLEISANNDYTNR